MLKKPDILMALAKYYEQGDLQFIEMVNNATFSYKVELHNQRKLNNLTLQNNEQSRLD
jgi:hypothetical protein